MRDERRYYDSMDYRQVNRSRARARSVRSGRYAIFSLIFPVTLLIVMLTVLAFLVSGSVKTEAASAHTSYKYYTSIRVESGDTLWNIAQENMSCEYSDIQEYIDEVCTINHITENDIHSGEYITIPYYSEEYLQ